MEKIFNEKCTLSYPGKVLKIFIWNCFRTCFKGGRHLAYHPGWKRRITLWQTDLWSWFPLGSDSNLKNSKHALDDGKRETAEASLLLFPLPIFPCALSFFPLPSLPMTKRNLCGGGRWGVTLQSFYFTKQRVYTTCYNFFAFFKNILLLNKRLFVSFPPLP